MLLLGGVLYVLKLRYFSQGAPYSLISQFDERSLDHLQVIYTLALWLADMASDIYVIVIYMQHGMYIFGSLLVAIWLTSGFLAFLLRRSNWKASNKPELLAAGLNHRYQPKPGLKSCLLHILQLQPFCIALDSSFHMSEEFNEEKVLTALSEGAPSSLLQIYALMVEGPKGNPAMLCGSILSSVLTVASGINNSYEVFRPPQRLQEPGKLPKALLTGYRMCDVFARLGIWALLGMAFRPSDAKRHGVQQPYLPFIIMAELVLTSVLFKYQLRLTSWWDMLKKQNFIGLIQSSLGTFWCCHQEDLQNQRRFAQTLLALRALEAIATVWFFAWMHSAGECLLADQPAVVIVALLSVFAMTITLTMALGHEISTAFFAVNLFPVIGVHGGRLEFAAIYGVVSQVQEALKDLDYDQNCTRPDRRKHNQTPYGCVDSAFCQAAEAGHIPVVQAFIEFGIPATAKWAGQTAAHSAAWEGHAGVIEALQALGVDFLQALDDEGNSPLHIATQTGQLDVVKALKKAGCDMDKENGSGLAPIHMAAYHGHLNVVKFMMEAGCNMNKALHGAVSGNQHRLVQFLIPLTDINTPGLGGAQPLNLAQVEDPNGPVTEELLKAGAVAAPQPQLVGLTALWPQRAPDGWTTWFTCGLPDLAQSSGKFYFEIQLLSEFQYPQIGWLTTDFQAADAEDFDGNGVGDDEHGWAFDGQRCKFWHDGDVDEQRRERRWLLWPGQDEVQRMKKWKVNDVLGFALDMDAGNMQLRNGQVETVTVPFSKPPGRKMQLGELI